MAQLLSGYQDKDTIVHRANPVVKLVWTVVIVIVAMLVEHPLILTLVFLSTLPSVAAGRLWKQWRAIMQFAFWMGLVVIIINCLAGSGGSHILWELSFSLPVLGKIRITLEAIIYGVFMTVRLMTIISAFSIITFTIKPDDLLSALIVMRIPYRTALLTSLSIRFVPTMFEDASRIADAQRSRGLEMDKGSKLEQLKNKASILPSLLSASLERTIQVAESMEARAFGSPAKRTQFFKVPFKKTDIVIIILLVSALAVVLYTFFVGNISYDYYPSLQNIALGTEALVAIVILLMILAGMVPIEYFSRNRAR